MTRDEFQRWKHDGKQVWEVIKGKVREKEYYTARSAGQDSGTDRFNAGYIAGLEAVLEIDWEEEEDVNDQGA